MFSDCLRTDSRGLSERRKSWIFEFQRFSLDFFEEVLIFILNVNLALDDVGSLWDDDGLESIMLFTARLSLSVSIPLFSRFRCLNSGEEGLDK